MSTGDVLRIQKSLVLLKLPCVTATAESHVPVRGHGIVTGQAR